MLYSILKFPAKIALLIWCRRLRINKKEILNANGPLLIAANHPNSFLDAILLASVFKKPVYALARGDAFKNPLTNRILRSLKMFPVYRLSEGAENLESNYHTFDECINIFKQNGIVLIFSEGRCINEWQLRPLKKGTARLTINAWEQGIPLKVIPAGINYSSFRRFGKNVQLNFGNMFSKDSFPGIDTDVHGIKIQKINTALKTQLEQLVISIQPATPGAVKERFKAPVPALKKILLFIPALIGYIIHAPLYIPVQQFAFKKFSKIDHYDSVVLGMLFLSYPFYLIILFIAVYLITCSLWSLSLFIVLPFTAWSCVQLKKQF